MRSANPSASSPTARAIGRRLTRRYIVALGLLASVLVVTHFVLGRHLAHNDADAYVVNISGMQRMLSQRVALYANVATTAASPEARRAASQRLTVAIDRMASNHAVLASGRTGGGERVLDDDQVEALYFSDARLDADVRAFLLTARRVAAAPEPASASLADALFAEQAMLLPRLDDVVTTLQLDAEAKLARLQLVDRGFFGLGILVLLLEALLIFRPMVRRIESATSALERSKEEMAAFTYRVSHDLAGPVRTAATLAELLGLSDPETREDALTHLTTALGRLGHVVTDITKLSRVRLERGSPAPQAVLAAASNVRTYLESTVGLGRVELSVEVPADLHVLAAPPDLRLMLENLIGNAVTFHAPDADRPYVRVTACAEGDHVRIAVEDNGLGIPERCRPKLFAMFERFHPRVAPGSGLGLYAVRQTAEELGGRVLYVPTPVGSTFQLLLPRARPARLLAA
ncbi:MAG: ATP-binding protein [Deltaproteobacteria bacterium]